MTQKITKNMPCIFYNQGTCNQPRTHETKGIVYRHICAACFTNGKTFAHPQVDCKNKLQKSSKKRISLAAHVLSTHAYSHRNFYNSKIPNASHNCQTTKKQALHWYNTWAAFQNVRPHKTYAQALFKNSGKKVVTRDATNVSPTSATRVHNLKARPHVLHANVHPPRANPVKNNHANTGKRQRTVPNNQNVPVPLHYRFQVLTNLDAESEASV